MDLGAAVFYALSAATIVAALGVVVTRSVVYSALLLILSLSLTGLVYLVLLSDFLALIQILVYGGTVSVLVLFAMMLTPPQQSSTLNHRGWPLALAGAVALGAVLIYGAVATSWPVSAGPVERVGPQAIGTALFGTWAVPFEIASLVLLVALIGSLVIARSSEAGASDAVPTERG